MTSVAPKTTRSAETQNCTLSVRQTPHNYVFQGKSVTRGETPSRLRKGRAEIRVLDYQTSTSHEVGNTGVEFALSCTEKEAASQGPSLAKLYCRPLMAE